MKKLLTIGATAVALTGAAHAVPTVFSTETQTTGLFADTEIQGDLTFAQYTGTLPLLTVEIAVTAELDSAFTFSNDAQEEGRVLGGSTPAGPLTSSSATLTVTADNLPSGQSVVALPVFSLASDLIIPPTGGTPFSFDPAAVSDTVSAVFTDPGDLAAFASLDPIFSFVSETFFTLSTAGGNIDATQATQARASVTLTYIVDAPDIGSEVPLPGAIPLFMAGVATFGAMKRRKS